MFYEQSVTQNLQPIVHEARKIAASDVSTSNDAQVLQSNMRINIQELIKLEGDLSYDLHILKELRAEMVRTHEDFAKWMAYRYSEEGKFPKAPEVAEYAEGNNWPTVPEGGPHDSLVIRDAVLGLERAS